jgi:hypothetical protein
MTPKQFEREVTAFFGFDAAFVVGDYEARAALILTIWYYTEPETGHDPYWSIRADNDADIWGNAFGDTLLEAYENLHVDVLECLDERKSTIDGQFSQFPVSNEQA